MATTGYAAELRVGGATISITPDQPVALWGQMHTRISTAVESPVTATVLAIESVAGDQSLEQTVMVSCDLVAIPLHALEKTREQIATRLPGFPVNRIVLSATHTHTGPVMTEGLYDIPAEGVMQPTEYVDFFAERVAEAVVAAWNSRKPGKASWGLGHAVVAQNRRTVYEDGTAAMYGVICMLNIDMIGRNEESASEPASENMNTIHLVGSKDHSMPFHEVTEEANKSVGFVFEYDEEDRVDGRSDHASFSEKGIPVTFLFGGFSPYYHKPTDTMDGINFSKIANAARLDYLVLMMASEHGRFPLDAKP